MGDIYIGEGVRDLLMAKFDEAVSKGDGKMTEKVKVPREVADAVKVLKEGCQWNGEEMLNFERLIKLARAGYSKPETIIDYIGKVGRVEYTKAIINGYEVEATPEERLREYYGKISKALYDPETNGIFAARVRGESNGLRKTLDILGIEIAGINAKEDAE